MNLAGKVAIVTGGGAGIGRAAAIALAEAGAATVVADVDLGAAKAVANEISQASGQALALAVDVSSATQTAAMAKAAVEEFGGVDLLYNNAAIQINGSVTALDEAGDRIRVNCICPGSIDTPLLRSNAAALGEADLVLERWGSAHPIGRVGQPIEIA